MSKIPKVIHYVWLGHNEKSDLIKQCMETWKQLGYEIKEWNEENFDINYNNFTKQAYEKKKYAFVSDVIRLYALYTEGGIYLDTDVMVYKSLDEFLDHEAFTGFECYNYPVCATMGSVKGNPLIKELLDYYEGKDFEDTTNTRIISDILEKHGINRTKNEIQTIENITIYPQEYFNDSNGYTLHCMEGSWLRAEKMKVSLIVPVYNQEELVLRALDSIPRRDDIEVIIVNDGSTDRTKENIENYKKHNLNLNIKIINLEENKGLGNAKNVGYDNSTGEYINQLDSDDYLYTEEYNKVIDELDGTDIVYMNLQINDGTIFDVNEETQRGLCSGCARFIRREYLGNDRCPIVQAAEDWYLNERYKQDLILINIQE